MIGIVVVSHSPALARAALDFALEMVPAGGPEVAIAAGGPDGVTGTNAIAVAEAVAKVASPDGVLVLADLGSAVLSAETAVELAGGAGPAVRVSAAPFVEGLLAAVVAAAGGASLEAVDREARRALAPKQGHLPDEPAAAAAPPPAVTRDVRLTDPTGLHARPAARMVAALAGLDAAVTVTDLRTGHAPVVVSGVTALLALDARRGDVLRFGASGPDADEALRRVADLVGADGAPPPAAAPAAPGPPGQPLGVSPGRGLGPVVHMPEPVGEPAPGPVVPDDERDAEVDRLRAAAADVAADLRARAARAGDEARSILEANALVAVDRGVLDDARAHVRDAGLRAAPAAWYAFTAAAEAVAAAGGLFGDRVADVADVRSRVVARLEGLPAPGVPERSVPFVLVARDLAPADAALLDPAVCRGLVTAEGSPTSHAAILARSLGLPAVVRAPAALDLPDGTPLLVDGTTGELVADPPPELVARVTAATEAPAFAGTGALRDGTPVALCANVGGPADVDRAVAARAQGVGLLRTEFLFLGRAAPPSVDEQADAYAAILARFRGELVVVRTLDAGADKPLAFAGPRHEPNPALGVRGLRTSWRDPGLLADQLDAIARAGAATGTAPAVMAPMVSTVDEARGFVALSRAHGLERAGVMIETPAAAVVADELLAAVDFVSLGTNDLVQYTMAADRLSGELVGLNDPWQPAALRLVARVGTAGARTGTPVGVCGEAAGDPLLAAVLVGAGATSLSMAPALLGTVAATLAAVDLADCERAARAALATTAPEAARQAARAALGG